jgi:hypothetical protein
LDDLPGEFFFILDNLGWYNDVTDIFIRQRHIQIVPRKIDESLNVVVKIEL